MRAESFGSASSTKERLGFTHPERGLALSRFASLQHARGHDREALINYFDVLAIFELAYGPEHPHIATTLHSIAVAHKSPIWPRPSSTGWDCRLRSVS